jgi:hypothetical protein
MENVYDLQEERELRASPLDSLLTARVLLDAQIADMGDPADLPANKRDKMATLMSKKAGLDKRITAEQKAITKEANDEARRQFISGLDKDELEEEAMGEIRRWLKSNDYYYTHSDATYWLYTNNAPDKWTPHSRSSLVNHDPRLDTRNTDYFRLFTRVLHADGRWFRNHARTFAPVGPGTLNMLRWDFLKPKPGTHNIVFDLLMASLGDGRKENIEHIEKVLVAKLLNPSNYTLPTIVLSDDGGTGKSLFAEKLLPTIFGHDLVAPNVAMDEVTGQFNSHLTGKAIWFINENRPDANDQDGIKRVLGSATIRSERKGKDAKSASNTALVFVAGNFTLGAIKLAGTEVDRRFSILCNRKPLHYYTAEVFGLDAEAAKTWMWDTGQHLISDPEEVAKWLNHLIEKHGRVSQVMALHGEDYHNMLKGQADTAQQVYKTFFNSEAWNTDGYFKQNVMFNFYSHYCRKHGVKAMSNQRFYAEALRWAKINGVNVERKMGANWETTEKSYIGKPAAVTTTTASLFVNPDTLDLPKGRFASNDALFFDTDYKDSVQWHVEID